MYGSNAGGFERIAMFAPPVAFRRVPGAIDSRLYLAADTRDHLTRRPFGKSHRDNVAHAPIGMLVKKVKKPRDQDPGFS
jgi:hypothetical protein